MTSGFRLLCCRPMEPAQGGVNLRRRENYVIQDWPPSGLIPGPRGAEAVLGLGLAAVEEPLGTGQV